jgi:hypothetical protein
MSQPKLEPSRKMGQKVQYNDKLDPKAKKQNLG